MVTARFVFNTALWLAVVFPGGGVLGWMMHTFIASLWLNRVWNGAQDEMGHQLVQVGGDHSEPQNPSGGGSLWWLHECGVISVRFQSSRKEADILSRDNIGTRNDRKANMEKMCKRDPWGGLAQEIWAKFGAPLPHRQAHSTQSSPLFAQQEWVYSFPVVTN